MSANLRAIYKAYPGIDRTKDLAVFFTVKSSASHGSIIEMKYTKSGKSTGTTFKIFSGRDSYSGRKERSYMEPNGRIIPGRYFITLGSKGSIGKTPSEILSKISTVKKKDLLNYPDNIRKREFFMKLYLDDRFSSKTHGDHNRLIDDYTMFNKKLRNSWRLHYGLVSDGCITFNKAHEYEGFLRILSSQTPFWVNHKTGHVTQENVPNSFQAFGILDVK